MGGYSFVEWRSGGYFWNLLCSEETKSGDCELVGVSFSRVNWSQNALAHYVGFGGGRVFFSSISLSWVVYIFVGVLFWVVFFKIRMLQLNMNMHNFKSFHSYTLNCAFNKTQIFQWGDLKLLEVKSVFSWRNVRERKKKVDVCGNRELHGMNIIISLFIHLPIL